MLIQQALAIIASSATTQTSDATPAESFADLHNDLMVSMQPAQEKIANPDEAAAAELTAADLEAAVLEPIALEVAVLESEALKPAILEPAVLDQVNRQSVDQDADPQEPTDLDTEKYAEELELSVNISNLIPQMPVLQYVPQVELKTPETLTATVIPNNTITDLSNQLSQQPSKTAQSQIEQTDEYSAPELVSDHATKAFADLLQPNKEAIPEVNAANNFSLSKQEITADKQIIPTVNAANNVTLSKQEIIADKQITTAVNPAYSIPLSQQESISAQIIPAQQIISAQESIPEQEIIPVKDTTTTEQSPAAVNLQTTKPVTSQPQLNQRPIAAIPPQVLSAEPQLNLTTSVDATTASNSLETKLSQPQDNPSSSNPISLAKSATPTPTSTPELAMLGQEAQQKPLKQDEAASQAPKLMQSFIADGISNLAPNQPTSPATSYHLQDFSLQPAQTVHANMEMQLEDPLSNAAQINKANIKLEQGDLGLISATIEIVDHKSNVTMVVASDEAKHVLQAHLAQLKDVFNSTDMVLAQVTVDQHASGQNKKQLTDQQSNAQMQGKAATGSNNAATPGLAHKNQSLIDTYA